MARDRALAARDRWDDKLRRRGHRLRWRKISAWPRVRYLGTCTNCAGMVECGIGRAWTGGVARECRPDDRRPRGRR